MRQEDRSRSARADVHLEFLVVQIDQTIAALGRAENGLENLTISRLPQLVESLEIAASEVVSLREALLGPRRSARIPAALRTKVRRLEHASGRVSALFQAAKDFHAGLLLVRARELAEYDALGGVSDGSAALVSSHALEARG